jgi:hypothetical protein
VDNAVFLIAGAVIAALVLWELTHEWRIRRTAHRERLKRDAEAEQPPQE